MFPEFTDAVAPDSPLLQNLNPEQLAAVTLPATHALILAGAGSGKTRVLTTRIAWLLQTGQVSPGGILAVTFTNKAAKEMNTRLSTACATASCALITNWPTCLRPSRSWTPRTCCQASSACANSSTSMTSVSRPNS
jgi:ATP-dependent exoDNAse (exonuclease V) beta subunit